MTMTVPFRCLPWIPGDGPAVVEWTAVALPDNTVALFGRDVTLDINLRDALAESRQRFRDLVDISSDFAWETGTEGRVRLCLAARAPLAMPRRRWSDRTRTTC